MRPESWLAAAVLLAGLSGFALWALDGLAGGAPSRLHWLLAPGGRWLVAIHALAALTAAVLLAGRIREIAPWRGLLGWAALVSGLAAWGAWQHDPLARMSPAPPAHFLLGAAAVAALAGPVRGRARWLWPVVVLLALPLPVPQDPGPEARPPASLAEHRMLTDCGDACPAPGAGAFGATCQSCHGANSTDPAHDLHRGHVSVASCQDCHRGSSPAASAALAHGAHPWIRTEPVLAGPFAEATCSGCHGPTGPPAGAEVFERGRRLWTAGGCAGCHESGDRLGPELARMAGWWGLAPVSVTGVALAARAWPAPAPFLAEAIRVPETHLPPNLPAADRPAIMPAFTGSDDDLQALTIYVLSLRDWRHDPGQQGPPRPDSGAAGAALFADPERGCAACHAFANDGGALGPALDHWVGREPGELRDLLLDSERQPLPGYPPVHPRDLGARLSDEELDRLVRYLVQADED